nr:pectin acetylesterase 8-like [Ipomoea batatas]
MEKLGVQKWVSWLLAFFMILLRARGLLCGYHLCSECCWQKKQGERGAIMSLKLALPVRNSVGVFNQMVKAVAFPGLLGNHPKRIPTSITGTESRLGIVMGSSVLLGMLRPVNRGRPRFAYFVYIKDESRIGKKQSFLDFILSPGFMVKNILAPGVGLNPHGTWHKAASLNIFNALIVKLGIKCQGLEFLKALGCSSQFSVERILSSLVLTPLSDRSPGAWLRDDFPIVAGKKHSQRSWRTGTTTEPIQGRSIALILVDKTCHNRVINKRPLGPFTPRRERFPEGEMGKCFVIDDMYLKCSE